MLNLALTNIFNDNREIYLFYRVGNDLTIMRDNLFFPYYYEKNDRGIFLGYNGEKLNKIFTRAPYEIPKKRTSNSMESDIIYTKRYLIDKINIIKAKLRYIIFETLSKKCMPLNYFAYSLITTLQVYGKVVKLLR